MIPLAVTADIPRDFGFSFRQRLAHGFVHVHHPVFTRMVQIEHCVGAIVTGRTRGPSYGSRIPVIAGRIEEDLIGTVSFHFAAINPHAVRKLRRILPGRQRGNVELHQRQRFAVFRAPPVLPVILHQ